MIKTFVNTKWYAYLLQLVYTHLLVFQNVPWNFPLLSERPIWYSPSHRLFGNLLRKWKRTLDYLGFLSRVTGCQTSHVKSFLSRNVIEIKMYTVTPHLYCTHMTCHYEKVVWRDLLLLQLKCRGGRNAMKAWPPVTLLRTKVIQRSLSFSKRLPNSLWERLYQRGLLDNRVGKFTIYLSPDESLTG